MGKKKKKSTWFYSTLRCKKQNFSKGIKTHFILCMMKTRNPNFFFGLIYECDFQCINKLQRSSFMTWCTCSSVSDEMLMTKSYRLKPLDVSLGLQCVSLREINGDGISKVIFMISLDKSQETSVLSVCCSYGTSQTTDLCWRPECGSHDLTLLQLLC